ncbi:unnamed protein product [Adineta ricciae]|uniref:Uncharacterized protein n=1 Tax=Adineta ricciae TaxID=249248 RepID=A0A815JMS4_ADIRI|nr:unnamed protein product [Adineta ricciae]CAF1378695.1 unnamed protein product [Adineta ricciae]
MFVNWYFPPEYQPKPLTLLSSIKKQSPPSCQTGSNGSVSSNILSKISSVNHSSCSVKQDEKAVQHAKQKESMIEKY